MVTTSTSAASMGVDSAEAARGLDRTSADTVGPREQFGRRRIRRREIPGELVEGTRKVLLEQAQRRL